MWGKYAEQDEGRIIDSLMFANKSDRPALQAADYITYEVMRFHRSGNDKTFWDESPLLSRLSKRGSGFVCQFHTVETIRGVIERGPIGFL
jgi:hypothetical protein